MRRLLLAAVLPLALAACDGGGDPVEQAVREVAANNHARTVKDGTVSAPVDHAAMGHTAAGPTEADRLYAEGEAEMHRLMAAASGKTADEAYINKMIAHHQGAVAMARTALENAKDPQVREWAQAVITAQEREIAEMKAWQPARQD
ncbi:DUF305 domain-containing protein [Brevundimonas sp.]|uniref:DUF305 domain-containing protein n=1 Tax=Brevundimonas sp. TaxID=1871086 RepID=UPI002899CC95|nr:DUF305 domain-containing protein [Brevundimonas sp.]